MLLYCEETAQQVTHLLQKHDDQKLDSQTQKKIKHSHVYLSSQHACGDLEGRDSIVPTDLRLCVMESTAANKVEEEEPFSR